MLLFSESTFQLYALRRLREKFKTVYFKSLAFVRTLICQASFIRTTRTFRPDSLLCPEASNYSKLHPSGRFSNTSIRPSVFDKWQPSGRRGYSIWTLSLIRQVVQKMFNRLDVSLHYSDAHTLL